MPLSSEDRARLEEEEVIRHKLRGDLEAQAQKGFWRTLAAPDNVKWLIASLMIPIATGVWGLFDAKRHEAERHQEVTIAEARKDVDQMTALIPSLSSDKASERTIGIAVLSSLVNAREAGPGLSAAYRQIQVIVGAGQQSSDMKVRKEAALDAESLYQGGASSGLALSSAAVTGGAKTISKAVALTPPSVASAMPRWVYLQLYREADRSAAERLRDALREDGVPVPGIENVLNAQGARVLKAGQLGAIDVRYFRDADRDAALGLAGRIARVLPQFGVPTLKQVSGVSGRVRPGLVEVWFPCAADREACLALGR
ncbi:hypothetical protein [Phenylobacterium sp.]|uniref:hypothetical protein n=1 Tax=Phenylobacterium sp. TaxID=1871053 RepID=UPI0025E1449D|nr:hypothetical protein [Phenylobacterium sp.]